MNLVKEFYSEDQSTVFSIVPYEVRIFCPGLYPGNFVIPGCLNDEKPVKLPVEASEHLMAIADQKRPTRIVTPSFVVARAIVTDFLSAQLWTTPDIHPGIMWMQGDISLQDLKEKHQEKFKEMRETQRRWYVYICKKTDDEWNKYKNSRVVSNQARFAAKVLGLTPEWLTAEVAGFDSNKCPACGSVNLLTNAICVSCHCILDEAKYKSLKFAS